MLGFDGRAARYTWTVALTAVALLLLYEVRKTLFVFILALLLAYLLFPLVNLLNRVLPTNRARPVALALAYIIFIGLMVLMAINLGERVIAEAQNFAQSFPKMLSDWESTRAGSPALNSLKDQIIDRARTVFAANSGDVLSTIERAGVKALSVASDVVFVIVIPILSFFFLKDGQLLRQHILDLVDKGPQRALLDDVMEDVHLLLAHYMRALVLLSLAAFTAYSIAFEIMGISYAVLLAALGGMLEFIPMLGPLVAGVIITIVTLVSRAPVLVVLIFLLAYRVFQDYILSPQLMRQGVALHPLLVLFGVFAGAELAGIPGTFLSVPVLALARLIYVRIRKAKVTARLAPEIPEEQLR
ncbi:MAG TPA: AI-2E family transporter [Bryobacteraceae bacterium]|nr:AI-2E family transporter [Bryobacteraceae bacterium]